MYGADTYLPLSFSPMWMLHATLNATETLKLLMRLVHYYFLNILSPFFNRFQKREIQRNLVFLVGYGLLMLVLSHANKSINHLTIENICQSRVNILYTWWENNFHFFCFTLQTVSSAQLECFVILPVSIKECPKVTNWFEIKWMDSWFPN